MQGPCSRYRASGLRRGARQRSLRLSSPLRGLSLPPAVTSPRPATWFLVGPVGRRQRARRVRTRELALPPAVTSPRPASSFLVGPVGRRQRARRVGTRALAWVGGG